MRFGKIATGLAAGLAMSFAAATSAGAAVVAFGSPSFPAVTVTPNNFIEAYYSTESNADVGNQSPANVTTVLSTWFGQPLTFVGGGACGASPTVTNGCSSFASGGGQSNKAGLSNIAGQVYGVHFGNRFIAFLYSGPQNGFQITGLRFGVSNIYVFNAPKEVPVPGALFLMGSALAGLGFANRRKAAA